ncbi:MAG: tetratricopeptide repeat protein [Kiritimatiellae bacterium]|nr:tetratricopeptide repeat protein [Kiritimatiellia bacterium]
MGKTKHRLRILGTGIAILVCVAAGCYSERLERHLKRADYYYEKGRYREAAIEYSNVLRLNRSHPQALRRLAFCRYELGELRDAGQLLLAAREVDPGNPEIEIRLGKLHLLARSFKEAYEIAFNLLASNATNHEAVLLLCEAAVTTQQWEYATGALERSGLKDVRPVMFYLALGNINLRQGNKDQAEANYRRACEAEPKAAQPHEALGKLYASRGEFQRAEEEFLLAAELEPPGTRARLLLAEMNWNREKYEDAKKILEEIVRLSPAYSPALMLLGRITLAEHDYSKTLELAERILAKRPNDFAGLLLRTQALFAKGDLEQAGRECEKMAKRFPDSAAVRHQLALIYLRQNDVKKAVLSLKKAVANDSSHMPSRLLLAELQIFTGELPAAVASLEEIVRENPGLLRGHLLLGMALRASQQPSRAVSVYEKAIELFSEDARLYYALGTALRDLKEEDKAALQFEKALALKPGWIAPLTYLVIHHVRKRDFDGAVRRVNDEMAKADNKAEMRILLGKIRFLQKNYAEAESHLLEAIRLDPHLSAAYQLLATIYSITNRDKECLGKLEEAITVNPRDCVSMMLAAMMHQRANRKDRAIELYERVLAVMPRFVPAANNLAYLYVDTPGKLDKALELAKMARDAAPNDPYVADTLGWVLYHKGDLRWAVGLLRESVERLPDQPEALYHLGAAYYKLGNIRAASDMLRKSMSADDVFSGKDKIRVMLYILDLDPKGDVGEEALGVLREHLKTNPGDCMALYREAQILQNRGQAAEAMRLYETLVRDHPEFGPAYVGLAALLIANPATRERGLTLARKARDLAPEDPEIAEEVGWVAYQVGQYAWANSLLQQAALRLPENSRTAVRFGWSLYMLGRVDEAIKELQRAVTLGLSAQEEKSVKEALALMRLWKDSARQREEVMAQARTVLENKREELPSLMLVARAREYEGKLVEAMKIYEEICRRYPEFVAAAAELALLHVETGGDLGRAYKLATMARDRLPKEGRVAGILGMVAYHRGNFEWAASLTAEALGACPDDVDLLYYRGLALSQLGKDRDSARTLLQRALDVAPQHRMSQEARRKLAEVSSGE